MGKVLQDLSAGRLIPYEMEKSERYKNARVQMREKEDALEEKLNKFDKALVRELRELLDAYTDLFTIEQEEDFSNGFKIGVRMMCEVFGEEYEDNEEEDME